MCPPPGHCLETPKKSVPVFLAGAAFHLRLGGEGLHNTQKILHPVARFSKKNIFLGSARRPSVTSSNSIKMLVFIVWMDQPARAYLKVIARDPDGVHHALNTGPQ